MDSVYDRRKQSKQQGHTMIILTGFTPFPGVPVNPSEKIVSHIAALHLECVCTEVLPTAFMPAGDRIRTLIREHQPRAVVSLGVAASRPQFSLERFALNVNDAPIPDNDGHIAQGQPIVPGGAEAYRSTLPLDKMLTALTEKGIPVAYSNHAGAYVCNHVFYIARHEVEQQGLDSFCGFIHIPMMHDHDEDKNTGLPLQTMTDGVLACLEILR